MHIEHFNIGGTFQLKSLLKKSFYIPCDDLFVYPSEETTKLAVARFCAKEGYQYEFLAPTKGSNMRVVIGGKEHEIICRLGKERLFRGYCIICREL